MKVATWLAKHSGQIVTVAPESTLEQVVDRLVEQPCLRDLYVMTADHRIIGHLSHKRLSHQVLAGHRPVHSPRQLMERVAGGTARDLMDAQFAYAREDEKLENVVHRLLEQDVEDLPVLNAKGHLVGGINLTSLLREVRHQSNFSGHVI